MIISFSSKIFRHKRTYASMFTAIITMNILAHLQSNMLQVERPVSGYILPTIIGAITGFLFASNSISMQEKNHEQKRMLIKIVQALSIALDERDAYTYGHSTRVTDYSLGLAKRIELSEDELEMLEIGSILHDIGKIGVPDTILNKPQSLDEEEISLIKQHPTKGERIIGVSTDRKLNMISTCIRSHHERFDGKGYPDGLAGEKIPILARIIAVSDAFDAMTSLRPYRKTATAHEALEELLKCAGGQFDPFLAKHFTEMMIEDDFRLMDNPQEAINS